MKEIKYVDNVGDGFRIENTMCVTYRIVISELTFITIPPLVSPDSSNSLSPPRTILTL